MRSLAELEIRHQTLAQSRAALERELLELDRQRQRTEHQTERAAAQAESRRAQAETEARRIREEAEAAAASAVARASSHAERLLAEAARERDRTWKELLGEHEEARAEQAEAMAALGRDIVRLHTTVRELQQQRAALDERIGEMRSQLRALESTRTDAEQMREHELPVPALVRFEHDHIVAALREEALRLRSELDGLGFERDRLQSNLSALVWQVNALESRRSDAESARVAAEEAVERLRGEAERQADALLEEARAEAARLRASGQQEADKLRATAEAHAVRSRAESDEVIATLLGRAEQAREELAELEQRRAADAGALEALRSELVDLERRRSVAAWYVGQEEARRERVRTEARAEAAEISAAHDTARQAVLVACQQAEEILAETDAEIAAMAAEAEAKRDSIVNRATAEAQAEAEALRQTALAEVRALTDDVVGDAASVLQATVQRSLDRLRVLSDHGQAWAEIERLRTELVSIIDTIERGDHVELAPVTEPAPGAQSGAQPPATPETDPRRARWFRRR